MNFSQGDKIYWFLGPYSTEASNAGDQKSVQLEGFRAIPSLILHPELLPSAPSRKELTLLHRLASPLKHTANSQKPYIIGEKLGQNKMGGAGAGGTYPQFSQKTEQCLPGET